MNNLIKLMIPIIPAIWKVLSGTTKAIVLGISVFLILAYTILISWASLRVNILNAYDDRWHELDNGSSVQRTQMMQEIRSDMLILKNQNTELKSDMRDIRNILMRGKP